MKKQIVIDGSFDPKSFGTVQLSDIFDAEVFRDLPAVNSAEQILFSQSGIIASSPLLNELADAPGKTADLPFWNDLESGDEPNVSDDDPDNVAVPKKCCSRRAEVKKIFPQSRVECC